MGGRSRGGATPVDHFISTLCVRARSREIKQRHEIAISVQAAAGSRFLDVIASIWSRQLLKTVTVCILTAETRFDPPLKAVCEGEIARD